MKKVFGTSLNWSKLLAREGVDITTISVVDKSFYDSIWRFTGKRREDFFTYVQGKHFTHYARVNFTALGRRLYAKYFRSPKQIKSYYEKGKKLDAETRKHAEYWEKRLKHNQYSQSSSQSSQALLNALNEFSKEFWKVCHFYSITPFIAIEAWQNDFEEMLSKMISRNGLNNVREKIFATVYTPWKKTALQEIRDKLARREDVEKLVEEYQFLRSWAIVWFRPIDATWINNLKTSSAAGSGKKFSLNEVKRLLKPTRREEKFIELAPYVTFFKDWRDDLRRRQVYYWHFLFEHIAKHFGVELNEIGYLSLSELKNALKENRFDRKLVEKRVNEPCVVTMDLRSSEIKVVSENLEKYEEIIKNVEKQNREYALKGLSAYPGVVKGIVNVIKTFHDVKRIQPGTILVANTTHPNYLPAMQKAAAFVTNEGGIISHAAIVARELKKPCVVGTKHATKILKDGDLVEVDAGKGVVKILKRG